MGSPNQQDADRAVTVQRVRELDRESCSGRGLHGAISVLRVDDLQSVTGRTELSGSNPFVQAEVLQLSHEAAISVPNQSTESERLSRSIGHDIERTLLSVRVEQGAGRVLMVTAEGNNLLLRLNDYKVPKKT